LLDLEGNDEGDDHKQRDNDHKEKNEEVKGANLTSPTNQSCKCNDDDYYENSNENINMILKFFFI
jgi:hypothetical protein